MGSCADVILQKTENDPFDWTALSGEHLKRLLWAPFAPFGAGEVETALPTRPPLQPSRPGLGAARAEGYLPCPWGELQGTLLKTPQVCLEWLESALKSVWMFYLLSFNIDDTLCP